MGRLPGKALLEHETLYQLYARKARIMLENIFSVENVVAVCQNRHAT